MHLLSGFPLLYFFDASLILLVWLHEGHQAWLQKSEVLSLTWCNVF